MPDLRLRVNGVDYAGWKSAEIIRTIEAVSGGFSLEVTDRWAGQSKPWPIRTEDECTLLVNGQPVITGYVDKSDAGYASDSRSCRVEGRDRAGDLVDCSAALSRWEYRRTSLLEFTRAVAKPFGIKVSLQAGVEPPKPIDKISVDPGASAFEAIESACRLAGMLPMSDGLGGLVLARAGSARAETELVEGENILQASGSEDATGRFREYRVLGQHQGSDETVGKAAASVKGTATDPGVRRSHRVLLVRADGNVTVGYAKRRAEWEATVRAGRASTASVTVQGWHQGDGSLWPLNALVRVRSPGIRVDDSDMLITGVRFSLSDSNGSTTQLTLARPDAFAPEPRVPTGGTGKGTAPWVELAGGVKAYTPTLTDDELEGVSRPRDYSGRR